MDKIQQPETVLYSPVKAHLQNLGYEVKGEIGACDLMACHWDNAVEPVIVEFKTHFTLDLLLQGIDRFQLTDTVYLAIPAPRKGGKGYVIWKRRRAILKLFRRLGLGLIFVHLPKRRPARVEVILDPAPYQPQKNRRRRKQLLGEFRRRQGDPNVGGQSRRSPVVTAYRQDALAIAAAIDLTGEASPAALRDATGIERAAAILQRNYYDWFERVRRGIYRLTDTGRDDLAHYCPALLDNNFGVGEKGVKREGIVDTISDIH